MLTVPHTNGRILLIEDNDTIREMLGLILNFEGYEIAEATDGVAGIDYLQSHHIPDLILLDLSLPLMNGGQFLAWIKQHPTLSSIPIVVMSGDPSQAQRVLRLGASEFLAKPLEMDILINTICLILAMRPVDVGLAKPPTQELTRERGLDKLLTNL